MWDFASELRKYGPRSPAAETAGLSAGYCAYVAKSHYENFTVASWFLPWRLQPHFHAIYAWCRWADDLADEAGNSNELLSWWRRELDACYAGCPTHPVTVALAATVVKYALPKQLFNDLLSAFEQDQRVKDYGTFEQILDYCSRSANPVGRIVLHLFECFDESLGRHADDICTGLQLANFWQDVARDFAMGRMYLPMEDRSRFGYLPPGFNQPFRELLKFEVERARGYFERGRVLVPLMPRRARLDVSLFVRAGEAILDAIVDRDYDVWSHRPTISKVKKLRIILSSIPSLTGLSY